MKFQNCHFDCLFYLYCPAGDEFYNAAFGGHVHIKYHNQDYHRPPLRHFVALFP